ncbi:MAG: aspartate--tRNA ligase [Tissierellia bacterium]|nr:aspartate--tRNA ligase [Tissierellia bacterium]
MTTESLGAMRRTHFCGKLTEENIGQEVIIMGWIAKARDLGALIFSDVRDYSGLVQVVFDGEDENRQEIFKKAKTLRGEFVVGIKGLVRERSSVNEDLPTGHIEILADQLKILSKSEVPPIYVKDDDTVSEEMRLKYRTLDLRKTTMQKNLRIRGKLMKLTRDFFDQKGFLEVETPVLNRPTPEGARDYVVPSRIHPGEFYALPQSPQLMKQLLMVAGFDRYIQITKCFRDEDLRANRQPEFTQIDMELSFVDREDIMAINEDYLAYIFKELEGIDLKLPLDRLTYDEAMRRFGSDKPDLRFAMELIDLSPVLKESSFKVFASAIEGGGSVRALCVKGGADFYSRKKIDKLEAFVKDFKAKGLAWMKVNPEDIQSPIKKFLSPEEIQAILDKTQAQVGDLVLFVADKNKVVFDALGNLRVHIAKEMDLIDKEAFALLWVTDFPLFEFDEEEDRYVAVHHPFTAPKEEDLDLLDKAPEKCRAQAYDIVINGDEMGGGSIRIHNPEVQKKMFKALGFTEEAAYEKFGFLIEAFKYGAPPHGGLAYGLDRLTMLFTGRDNIRDVIAFPKTQAATDLLTGAPNSLDPDQLKEVHINIDSREE